jgi:hypothetical protein
MRRLTRAGKGEGQGRAGQGRAGAGWRKAGLADGGWRMAENEGYIGFDVHVLEETFERRFLNPYMLSSVRHAGITSNITTAIHLSNERHEHKAR